MGLNDGFIGKVPCPGGNLDESNEQVINRIKAKYLRPIDEIIRLANEDNPATKFPSTHFPSHDSPQAALVRIAALQVDENDLCQALIAREQDSAEFKRLSGSTSQGGHYDDVSSWQESFDEWKELEYSHIKDMIKEDPCPEHIDVILNFFFYDSQWRPSSVDLLNFLFALPFETWEERFLSRLEAASFDAVWRARNDFLLLLEYIGQFNDKDRFLTIVKTWADELSRRIAEGWVPPAPSPEEKLLQDIFGKVTPASMLEGILGALSKFSSGNDPGG